MKLNDPQFDDLAKVQQDRFVRQACDDLARHFPAHAAGLGPDGLRAEVFDGIAKARRHGLEASRDLYRYLCLMARFGPDFDRDPALPWAALILASPVLGSPTDRLRRLCDTALACDAQTGRPVVPAAAPRWPTGAAGASEG